MVNAKVVFNEVINEHQAHLVPCIVKHNGATDEFKDQFIMDNELTEPLQVGKQVTYVRGRKIVGQPVEFKDSMTYLTRSRTDEDGNLIIEPQSKITQVVNYEREGNEERLLQEMSKFNELRALEALIHEI